MRLLDVGSLLGPDAIDRLPSLRITATLSGDSVDFAGSTISGSSPRASTSPFERRSRDTRTRSDWRPSCSSSSPKARACTHVPTATTASTRSRRGLHRSSPRTASSPTARARSGGRPLTRSSFVSTSPRHASLAASCADAAGLRDDAAVGDRSVDARQRARGRVRRRLVRDLEEGPPSAARRPFCGG